jgi:hypothetical protein
MDHQQFDGSPVNQAQCLLRKVSKWGKVESESATLPKVLWENVGEWFTLKNQDIAKLTQRSPLPGNLGNLDHKIAFDIETDPATGARRPVRDVERTGVKYFVIHDTSSPWYGDNPFPSNIEADQRVNRLSVYKRKDAVAHAFINRKGEVLQGHDFSVPWRATKFETKAIGPSSKGLFIHIELVQPRRRDPTGSSRNDALAPEAGFSAAQYERLAQLYIVASARANRWLIPAFHAVLDQGMPDPHDDPQNFDLSKFGDAIRRLVDETGDRVAG